MQAAVVELSHVGNATSLPPPWCGASCCGGAALRCFLFLFGAGFSTLLLFGAACFLPPSSGWC